MVETAVFDVMWSEHCSYKTSRSTLKKYLPTCADQVVLGVGEDAGIVHFVTHDSVKYGLVLAHESHNHPAQILPVEGAATGVGGCVRDVYCMGADVVGVLNSLHFSPSPNHPRYEPWINPMVSTLADQVVQGVAEYANPLGVPVLGGETLYHPSYRDNCLVNIAALGIVDESAIIHSYAPRLAKHTPHDIILVGKSTDRTGLGGATFSSCALDQHSSLANVGATQLHDPFLKRVIVTALMSLFAYVQDHQLDIGLKDLGAGGIVCATLEMVAHAHLGAVIDLDRVNMIDPDLDAATLACSETQERFCMIVPRDHTQAICDIFNDQYQLPKLYHEAQACVIGYTTTEPIYQLTRYGQCVCHLPVDGVAAPDTSPSFQPSQPSADGPSAYRDYTCLSVVEVDDALLVGCCLHPALMSKRHIYRCFDQGVRGDTVIYPGEADAVVITPIAGCHAGVAVSIDSNLYGGHDPYLSGAHALAESIRNVVAVGAVPLAWSDCLNDGNPEKAVVFEGFEHVVRGLGDAATQLSFGHEPLPVISGNVSFYNESAHGQSIIPSPVVTVVGRMHDYRLATTMAFKHPGSHIILIGDRYPEFGGTLLADYRHDLDATSPPRVRFFDEKRMNGCVCSLIENQWIDACHDVSSGGLWGCLVEMLVGERGAYRVGATLDIGQHHAATMLFSENAGFVIEVSQKYMDLVTGFLSSKGVSFFCLGYTTQAPDCVIAGLSQQTITIPIETIIRQWCAEDRIKY